MALWLFRCGTHGEHEKRFLNEKRVFFTWEGLTRDLSTGETREDFSAMLQEVYPSERPGTIQSWSRQAWAFLKGMQLGDWVAVPSKLGPAIHLGKITGPYEYDREAPDPYYHWRTVQWLATDVPRSSFDQDILYSLGAVMTICQITRNDAEARVKAMAHNGWKSLPVTAARPVAVEASDAGGSPTMDIEQIARDGIAKTIMAKFKGHGLARLVEAILKAQGYETYLSPAGPDKGVDILAAPGKLGFGEPRICVQVKSGGGPVDSPTVNQLIGTMQNVQALHGLFVSWDGFKQSVDREVPAQFFRVRLWDQDDLIDKLLENYEELDAELRAELPLKPIWTVAAAESDVGEG